MNSYNVTAIYHPADRYGIVTGAVDHDLWKNAIHVNATDYYKVNTLELMSGYAVNIAMTLYNLKEGIHPMVQ